MVGIGLVWTTIGAPVVEAGRVAELLATSLEIGGIAEVCGVTPLEGTGAGVASALDLAVVWTCSTGHIVVYRDTSSVVTWPVGQLVTSGGHEVTVNILVEYTVEVVKGGGVLGAIDELEAIIVGSTEELPERGVVVLTKSPLEVGATVEVPTDGSKALGELLESGSGEVPLETGDDELDGNGDEVGGTVSLWV